MRKIVALAVATGMALTVAACGGKEEKAVDAAPSAVATADKMDKMDKMESTSPEAMESASSDAMKMESASPEAMSPSEGASAPAGAAEAAVPLEKMTCKQFLEAATTRSDDPALGLEMAKLMMDSGVNVTDETVAKEFGVKLGTACVQTENAEKLVVDVVKTLQN